MPGFPGNLEKYMNNMKFRLFGTFILETEDMLISEQIVHSKKLIQLLTYFLLNRDRELSAEELIQIFCRDSVRRPTDTLKNLIYRLRTTLKSLTEEELIQTVSGGYQWNPEFPVESDVEHFEELAEKALDMKPSEEQKEACRTALYICQGDFPRRLMQDSWFEERAKHCDSLRSRLIKSICLAEEREARWENLEQECTYALEFDAVDEDVHCWMINSLCGQHKYEEAIRHYEAAKRIIFEMTGVQNSEKLQQAYTNVVLNIGRYIRNIGTVLMEAAEAEKPQGAYCCEYSTFRQIYQIEARKKTRLSLPDGISDHLVLMTVLQKAGEDPGHAQRGDIQIMDILGRTIQSSLRVGDVYSRCSPMQYIIMLSTCTYENAEHVAERIRSNFMNNIVKYPYMLAYDLDELKTYDVQLQEENDSIE